jgi:hypothetical protein
MFENQQAKVDSDNSTFLLASQLSALPPLLEALPDFQVI